MKINEKLEKLKRFNIRCNQEESNSRSRDPYNRDYARILYSAAFRRLQGKMQLLGVSSSAYYRNRLTHSLEVAQVARGICSTLTKDPNEPLWNTDELYLIEAISLAHDLGNPPFGHAGEAVLDKLADEIGGFEGNAQTFRIVTKLERKFPQFDGLNLTKRTLRGIVKYNEQRCNNSKKYLYDDDYIFVKKELELNDKEKTLDCQVMDLADEIAYAAHDFEDSLHQGILNAEDLLYMFEREKNNKRIFGDFNSDDIEAAKGELKTIIEKSREYALKTNIGDSDDLYEAVFRKELSSAIVNTLINDVMYDEEQEMLRFNKLGALSVGLKKLLFFAIKSDSEMILAYEKAGAKVITGLYEVFTDGTFNNNNELLSTTYRLFNNPIERKRRVVDYIAGMMDQYAIEQYIKYFGRDPFTGIYDRYLTK